MNVRRRATALFTRTQRPLTSRQLVELANQLDSRWLPGSQAGANVEGKDQIWRVSIARRQMRPQEPGSLKKQSRVLNVEVTDIMRVIVQIVVKSRWLLTLLRTGKIATARVGQIS